MPNPLFGSMSFPLSINFLSKGNSATNELFFSPCPFKLVKIKFSGKSYMGIQLIFSIVHFIWSFLRVCNVVSIKDTSLC